MSLRSKILIFNIFLIIAFHGVKCGHSELFSKLLSGHNYLVPPSSDDIKVTANLQLTNILQIDTRNQEMTFSAILNLYWNDSTLSWSQKEFPHVKRVALPSVNIWTPNIIIWNSAADFENIQSDGGDVFISTNGQVHWPIIGSFRTCCTIDVTYYPFDQQTCVLKIGPMDNAIQIDFHNKNVVDLSQYYQSVLWTIVEAPGYQNIYKTVDDEFPVESDVSYYLVLKRKTHWLSEVCPLLVFAFLTIIPAAVTRSLEKLLLQLFCIAGLFVLQKDIMTKLPPTYFVTPLASKFIVALIFYNLIHLILTTIINNCCKKYFDWIAHQIPIQYLTKRYFCATKRTNDDNEIQPKQDIENKTSIHNEDLSNHAERKTHAGGETIVVLCNRIISLFLLSSVGISTLCFLFGYPNGKIGGIA